MSDKLISVNYLFAKIDKWILECDGISFEELKKVLNNAPAVDAVAVVRCRDCKYWGSPTENQEAICRHWSSYYGSIRTMDDQYCSYGERREV